MTSIKQVQFDLQFEDASEAGEQKKPVEIIEETLVEQKVGSP